MRQNSNADIWYNYIKLPQKNIFPNGELLDINSYL